MFFSSVVHWCFFHVWWFRFPTCEGILVLHELVKRENGNGTKMTMGNVNTTFTRSKILELCFFAAILKRPWCPNGELILLYFLETSIFVLTPLAEKKI